MAPIELLQLGAEAWLRYLPDDEYDALEARVRPERRRPAKKKPVRVPKTPVRAVI